MTATTTTRIILRCAAKSCKAAWARDGKVVIDRDYTGRKSTRIILIDRYIELETCPTCGRTNINANAVNGTVRESVPCTSRCVNAVRPDCECECGGAHHAQGLTVTETV